MPFMFVPSSCYMPRRTFRTPSSSCGPCAFSPCANPMLFVAALFVLPTIMRVLFFGFTFLMLNVMPIVLIACFTRALLHDACYAGRVMSHTGCEDKKADAKTTKTKNDSKVKDEDEDEDTVECDLSEGVRTHIDEKQVCIQIAVPGLSSKDLDVSVVDDHVLRVSGETKKGGDVYRIARDFLMPPVDMETMAVKHEDGVLAVVAKRKIRRVMIPVASSSTVQVTAEEAAAPAASATTTKEDDDWEPLPARVEKAPATKKAD